MIEINGVTYLSIQECMALLEKIPLVISERTFRQKVRLAGCAREHRKQLFLTEADLGTVLDTMQIGSKKQWRSNSRGGAKSGTSGARSAASTTTKALALIHASTQKSGG